MFFVAFRECACCVRVFGVASRRRIQLTWSVEVKTGTTANAFSCARCRPLRAGAAALDFRSMQTGFSTGALRRRRRRRRSDKTHQTGISQNCWVLSVSCTVTSYLNTMFPSGSCAKWFIMFESISWRSESILCHKLFVFFCKIQKKFWIVRTCSGVFYRCVAVQNSFGCVLHPAHNSWKRIIDRSFI